MKEPKWKLFDVTAIHEFRRAKLAMFFGWKVCDTLSTLSVSRQCVGNQNLVSNYSITVKTNKKNQFCLWAPKCNNTLLLQRRLHNWTLFIYQGHAYLLASTCLHDYITYHLLQCVCLFRQKLACIHNVSLMRIYSYHHLFMFS